MASVSRAVVAGLIAFAAVAMPLAPALAAEPISRADYEACQSRDEAAFRAAIEAITLKALQSGTARLDYPAIVAAEWRKGGVDEVLDKRIDLAVAEVRDESSWGDLLRSLGNKEKAQALATAVAERVYRSDAVKSAIEGLAAGVGREVGKTIELATVDAGEPALKCLQAFLGPRYGTTVARVVGGGAAKEFHIDPGKGGARIASGAILAEHADGIAGAVVLIVRRQLASMATRLSQRMVGAVLGRLVSVAAGGVGVALIAKDIWDFRHGVMPIVASEMKARATKEKVQEEIARAIAEQIGEGVREIAAKTAERVADVWLEFRRAHAQVLDLADRHAPFKAFLDTTKPDQLARLDEVAALVLAAEAEPGVLKRLADGTLQEAVNVMPAAAMEIARETRSIAAALAWSGVAQGQLDKVVAHELYRRSKPEDFTRASLTRLFALDDRQAIVRLGGLSRAARDVLFEIDGAELKTLARGLGESELDTLARYLVGLEKSASQRVLRAVAAAPAKMQVLASARVRDALLASREQGTAVDMMLRSDSGLDLTVISDDLRNAYEGRISPLLLLDKHPIALGAMVLMALLVLLMLRRLLFPRRRAAAASRTA